MRDLALAGHLGQRPDNAVDALGRPAGDADQVAQRREHRDNGVLGLPEALGQDEQTLRGAHDIGELKRRRRGELLQLAEEALGLISRMQQGRKGDRALLEGCRGLEPEGGHPRETGGDGHGQAEHGGLYERQCAAKLRGDTGRRRAGRDIYLSELTSGRPGQLTEGVLSDLTAALEVLADLGTGRLGLTLDRRERPLDLAGDAPHRLIDLQLDLTGEARRVGDEEDRRGVDWLTHAMSPP